MFEKFSSEKGVIENLDEVIYAGDLQRMSPDKLFLNGNEIASVDFVRFKVEFKNEETMKAFEEEIKESGLANHILKELKLDELPVNVAAVVAADENLERVEDYYKRIRNDKNSVLSFVEDLLKSKGNKQMELLEKHRAGLKEEQINKSRKLRF